MSLQKEDYTVTFPKDLYNVFTGLLGRDWTRVTSNVPLEFSEFNELK